MAGEHVLIVDDSLENVKFLRDYVLEPNGYVISTAVDGEQGLQYALAHAPDLIIMDLKMPKLSGLEVMRSLKEKGKDIPVILMTFYGSEETAIQAFRLGAKDYLIKPFTAAEALEAIERALSERRLRKEKQRLEENVLKANQQLTRRVKEANILYSIGKSVAQLLDLEELLNRVVEAAIYITGAEEGSLFLVDESTGELYLRAARGLGEKFARGFRIKVDDSLVGQVVQTGQPIRIESTAADQEIKIKTGYLVKSLLQVPLKAGKRVIGVLSVDTQTTNKAFSADDQKLLSALADYAAISIVNAQLFQQLKQSRDEIKKWNEELERRVAQRTEELRQTQIQLSRSEQLAAVGQLAAGIAHEINNPLGIILGFTESILEQIEENHPLREPLHIVEREALRCKHIVQSLLDFSRQSLSFVPTDIKEVLENTLAAVQYQMSKQGIRLERVYEQGLPQIPADAQGMQQVFTNIILNAIQAMPEGGKLTAAVRQVDREIWVTIQDTGIGIPEENLAHIFEPFFTTKEVGKGTGLGLSLSYTIVKQHGGTIEVESTVGEGTSFTIKLPLQKVA